MLAVRVRLFPPWFKRIWKVINPEVMFKSNNHNVLEHLSIVRGIHGTNNFQKKVQYEYDPTTDNFLPKNQKAITHQNFQQDTGKSTLFKFIKNWSRTVFMITGGIVWGGLIFVALFVDVKDTNEFPFDSQNLDDEVRMLVFYNLAHRNNDLLKIFNANETKYSQSYDFEELHESMHTKQEILSKAIQDIRTNEAVIEILGKPVQMCGFRVADKIASMTQNVYDISNDFQSKKNQLCLVEDESMQNKWTAECIMEGSKGLAMLNLTFCRTDAEWVLQTCSLQKLEITPSPVIENKDLVRFI